MLSIAKCRKILGKVAENMTDEEIAALRNYFVALSDVVIDSVIATP